MKSILSLGAIRKIWICVGMIVPVLLSTSSVYDYSSAESLARSGQVAIHANSPNERIHTYALTVIDQLSRQETFATWKNAELAIAPLGPGTHSWYVTISTKSKPTGYLIIGAQPSGGYSLVEYGLGPDLLFSQTTLQSALLESGLIPSISAQSLRSVRVERLYWSPLLAEWRITPNNGRGTAQYLDARNEDWLPEEDKGSDLQQLTSALPQVTNNNPNELFSIQHAAQPSLTTGKEFDPNDNLLWISSKPLPFTAKTFSKQLKSNKRLVFVSKDPTRTYSLTYPIFGSQTWTPPANSKLDSIIYVLTGSATSPRWIALDELLGKGDLYVYSKKE